MGSLRSLVPCDTRSKQILAELCLHLKKHLGHPEMCLRFIGSGSGYLKIVKDKTLLKVRVSHHPVGEREDYDSSYSYIFPEFKDFNVLEFANMILEDVSSIFKVHIPKMLKSRLLELGTMKGVHGC